MLSSLVRPMRILILVAEEYRPLLEVLRRPGQRPGGRPRELTFAADAAEARALLQRAAVTGPRPELVVTDLDFARGEGRELLREWKRHPQLQRIPLVALVGEADESEVRACYEARANCLVVMPRDEAGRRDAIEYLETFWLTLAQLPSEERRLA